MKPRGIGVVVILAVGLATVPPPALSAKARIEAYDVKDAFQGKSAVDLSGIACVPLVQGKTYRCLLIDDESKKAQFAELDIDKRKIKAGDEIRLIGKSPSDETLGTPPDEGRCKPTNDFKELDGEGVAYAAPYFYVVGSHGCSRKKGKFRLSSFILARIHVDEEGRPIGAVETTYRLSDLLPDAKPAGEYFGNKLACESGDEKDGCGLNIEGIAVDGEHVYLGLRAPSLDGKAFIVSARINDLFAPGHQPAPKNAVETIPVALGPGVGIRDLALLPDGKLLILTGASYAPDIPYSIVVADKSGENLKTLSPPDCDQPTRAEGMAVLEAEPDVIKALLLFDGLPDGAPQGVRIPRH